MDYYMDVDGEIKTQDEWLDDYVKGRITLKKLYFLRKCWWNKEIERWVYPQGKITCEIT